MDLMLPKVFSKLYDFYWCQHPAPTQEDPTFLHLSIRVFTPKTNWESNAQLRAALPPPAPPTPSPAHSSHTRGSASRELGVVSLTVRSSGGETVLWGPMVGGGRWYSLDWSCCADGQGRVSRTHSTGSSQAAFCPWTCRQGAREVAPAHQTFTPPQGCQHSPGATSSELGPALCPHAPGCAGYLEPIFRPLLQVRDDGVVPQVNEPGPEILDSNGAGQEEAGTCRKRQSTDGSWALWLQPPAPHQQSCTQRRRCRRERRAWPYR